MGLPGWMEYASFFSTRDESMMLGRDEDKSIQRRFVLFPVYDMKDGYEVYDGLVGLRRVDR